MKEHHVLRGSVYLLCVSVLFGSAPAPAQTSLKTQGHEIVAGIVGVAAAVGVGIGVGVYFALHPTIKGCVSDKDGLEIANEKDHAIYRLTGSISDLKPGNVVSVRGRKKSAMGGSPMGAFRVDKVKRTWGTCAAPSNP